jgi:hypothetical protein
MSKKNGLPVGAAIGFLVGLFAVTTTDTAVAASECLAGPNRESGPGTHWHYRINQTTKERCWYLKKVGGASQPRPTEAAHSKPSQATRVATASRTAPVETVAPAESESSIKAWFTATFGALSGSSTTSTETREPATSETPRKRRTNTAERSESSKTARAQQRPSTSAATVEAVGDKSIATPSDREAEWQKALYEEFLQWRVKQLLFPQQ